MKFKTFLLMLLVGFAFASCSSDDDKIKNQAPNSFNLNKVNDGATQPQLSWEEATDPDEDDVAYKVYLDTENPPQVILANNLNINSFNVEDELQLETNYYWKVVAKDTKGNTTESAIASFTTRDKTNAEKIIGKWVFEGIEGEPDLSVCNKRSFMQFSEDLSLTYKLFTINSNQDCEVARNENYTYELIGDNHIKVSDDNDSTIWEIQSISQTELTLALEDKLLTLKKE